jgi:hypothetical protein
MVSSSPRLMRGKICQPTVRHSSSGGGGVSAAKVSTEPIIQFSNIGDELIQTDVGCCLNMLLLKIAIMRDI